MLSALDTRAYGRFLSRCFDDGRWAKPFAVDAGTRPFMTSSGCPHRCVFCSSNSGWRRPGGGHKIQRIVPLAVVEDWALRMRRDNGARRLFVLDEMANLRADFEDVLKAFDRLDLRYEFPNGLRADRLTASAIARMKDRVSLLSVSAESASAADLAGPIGKRQDPAEVERVVAEAARVGLPTLVHFIIGFPWETPESVQATLDFAGRLRDAHGAMPAVQFATPLRGTPRFDACLEAGLVSPDAGTSADGSLFQHRPAFLPPAIPEGFLEAAHASFRRRLDAVSATQPHSHSQPQAPAVGPTTSAPVEAPPGSNSFDYVPVRELTGFVLDPAHCTARALGLSTAGTNLVITQGTTPNLLTATIYNAAMIDTGLAWSNSKKRIESCQWSACRTVTSGTADPLFALAIS